MSETILDDWSPELEPLQRAFLQVYSLCGSVHTAAQGICSRATHYRWLQSSELYAENFALAKKLFGEVMVGEAIKRAMEGTTELVRYKGQVVTENGIPETRQKTDRVLLKHLMALFTAEKMEANRLNSLRQHETQTT